MTVGYVCVYVYVYPFIIMFDYWRSYPMILNSVLPFYPTFRRLTFYMTVCQYSSLIYPGHRPPSPLYKWRYNRDSLALQLSRVEALFLFFMELYFVLCIWAALGLPQQTQKDVFYFHYLNHRVPMRNLLEILGKPLIRLWEHMEKRKEHLSFGTFYKISWLKKMKSTSYAVLILW